MQIYVGGPTSGNAAGVTTQTAPEEVMEERENTAYMFFVLSPNGDQPRVGVSVDHYNIDSNCFEQPETGILLRVEQFKDANALPFDTLAGLFIPNESQLDVVDLVADVAEIFAQKYPVSARLVLVVAGVTAVTAETKDLLTREMGRMQAPLSCFGEEIAVNNYLILASVPCSVQETDAGYVHITIEK